MNRRMTMPTSCFDGLYNGFGLAVFMLLLAGCLLICLSIDSLLKNYLMTRDIVIEQRLPVSCSFLFFHGFVEYITVFAQILPRPFS